MGIKMKYLTFFTHSLMEAGIQPLFKMNGDGIKVDFSGMKMLELGNQIMKHWADPELKEKAGEFRTGKEFFSYFNFDHTSIDINGKDGALPIDLNFHVSNKLHNKFDIITNFGTTEHVMNQSACFENIFRMLKPEGIIVHIVPLQGGVLRKHGLHQYSLEFFNSNPIMLERYETVLPAEERDYLPGCISVCLRKAPIE